MAKRLGYYRKSVKSNKRLVELFENNQEQRYSSTNKDWADKKFTRRLCKEEIQARKEILAMLRKGQIKTSDDFYRAGHFFHHGLGFRSYALGLALFAVSYHLGEPWSKNYCAVALDRFLLSVKQPQYFVTQFEKRKGEWIISRYKKGVSDKERAEYHVESFEKTKKRVRKMNKDNY